MKKSWGKTVGLGLVLLVFAGALFWFLLPAARAEETPRLIVSPAKQEFELAPGASSRRALTVTNGLDRPARFSVSFEDFVAGRSPEEVVVFLGEKRSRWSLKDHLSVSPADREFVLSPGEAKTINVFVELPPNLPPTGLYGSVIVAAAEEGLGLAEAGARIITRLGALLFVRVAGEWREAGSVADFNLVDRHPWRELWSWFSGRRAPPLRFHLVFENSGEIYLNPYGLVKIFDWRGREAAFAPILPWFVLPDSLRARQIEINSHLGGGLYRARLELNLGYDNQVSTKTIWFWRFSPGMLIVILVLVAAVIKLVLWRLGKRSS